MRRPAIDGRGWHGRTDSNASGQPSQVTARDDNRDIRRPSGDCDCREVADDGDILGPVEETQLDFLFIALADPEKTATRLRRDSRSASDVSKGKSHRGAAHGIKYWATLTYFAAS